MGRFLCNYFTAHPNPEGPTHPHPPTYPPPQLSTWTLDISRTLESQFIPEVFLELIILRPRHDEYSRPFFGLITTRNEYSWAH